MANALITPTVIAREAHMQLQNALVMGSKVDRQHEAMFAKKGDTIKIRKPVRYTSVNGPDITGAIVDTEEANWDLTLSNHKTVPMQFSATDLTLTIEEFSKRYIKPAAIRIAADVENVIAGLYTKIYNYTGTAGTTPSTFISVGNNDVLLTNSGLAEGEDRLAFYEPTAALNLANTVTGVNPERIAKLAIEKAFIKEHAGFEVFRTVHAPTHTFGSNDGAGAVNGASQNVTYATAKNTWTQSLIVDNFTTTDTFKAGDIFTIAGVNAWNNQTEASTGAAQNFVVTADATMSSGAGTLTISPPIITSGPYQTVDAAPADNAVITVPTNSGEQAKQNLLFHPQAITLAMADYKAPAGLQSAKISENNISITYSWDGDILTHLETHRLDVLFGATLQVPQFACRHTS